MKDEARERDLRTRTRAYAGMIIRLYTTLPRRRGEVDVVGKQMLRSGTSVAANYREASRARSDAEFVSKIETCVQEADETDLWLELLRDECGITDESVSVLQKETDELISILVAIVKKVKARNR